MGQRLSMQEMRSFVGIGSIGELVGGEDRIKV